MYYMRQLTASLLIGIILIKNSSHFMKINILFFHMNSFFVGILIELYMKLFNKKFLELIYFISVLFLVLHLTGIFVFDANEYLIKIYLNDFAYGWYFAEFDSFSPSSRILYELVISLIIVLGSKLKSNNFYFFLIGYFSILFLAESFFFSLGELTNRMAFYFDIFCLIFILQNYSVIRSFKYLVLFFVVSSHGLYRGLSTYSFI